MLASARKEIHVYSFSNGATAASCFMRLVYDSTHASWKRQNSGELFNRNESVAYILNNWSYVSYVCFVVWAIYSISHMVNPTRKELTYWKLHRSEQHACRCIQLIYGFFTQLISGLILVLNIWTVEEKIFFLDMELSPVSNLTGPIRPSSSKPNYYTNLGKTSGIDQSSLFQSIIIIIY